MYAKSKSGQIETNMDPVAISKRPFSGWLHAIPTISKPPIQQVHLKDLFEARYEERGKQPHLTKKWLIAFKLFGRSFCRRCSNLWTWIFGRELLSAHRSYTILLPNTKLHTSQGEPLHLNKEWATAKDLAAHFQPRIECLLENTMEMPVAMYYEVFPPKEGQRSYLIAYYVGLEKLHFPLPILGWLYALWKPLWFGSSMDWHGVLVEINRDSLSLESVSFETANYTSDPRSFWNCKPSDLRLLAKVQRAKEKPNCIETVVQRNGQSHNLQLKGDFTTAKNPSLVYVAWNGALDWKETAFYLTCLEEPAPQDTDEKVPLHFLDSMTYKKEGFDLRVPWMNLYKESQVFFRFPARFATTSL